jgi:ABC-type transport system involved in cytochrome c biogenesis permease subunit
MSILMLLCITVPTWAQETVAPDWNALGRIAVLHEGRVKPLDTVARSSMLMICGKQSVTVQGRSMHALEWLMDVMCKPELSDRYRVFLIHDPDIEALLKLGEEDKRWSFMELQPQISLIADQAQQAQGVQSHQRNRYQRAILELYNHLTMYVMLKNSIAPEGSTNFGKEIAQLQSFTQWLTENPTQVDQDAIKQLNILKQHYETLAARSSIHFVPPVADLPWQRIGEHLRHVLAGVKMDPSVPLFAIIRAAYREGNWAMINKMVADHLDRPQEQLPKVRSEAMFNRVALLVNAMPVYVVGLLITLLAMVKYNKLLKLGVFVVIIAFVMHTFGLGWRMWIEGRPPVINLYGSAVFIGWGATLMALIMEKIYKNGLSNIAATLIGFSTLIIAHHLSLSGDTIEPVRAVLNSNFWLSTHVIIVTLGYSAMFVAGAIGMIFVVRDVILRNLSPKAFASMGRMAYGIICFAMLFSFVGTVLGGIWADQSWGRFWGWDPKENGALLIVLWNAATLHARWSGMIQIRGMMLMTLLGNCITAFSWFGVNMMGVGLHSYGFMDGAFFWLSAFWVSQLVLVAIGLFPVREIQSSPPDKKSDKSISTDSGV